MTTLSATPTPTPTTAAPKMPVLTTSSVMSLLWEKESRELHVHELEWLAEDIPEYIGQMTYSLSKVLMGLGCLIATDESTGVLQDKDDVPQLLFNLSHQVDAIQGLANIARDAGFLARRAQKEYQKGA